MQENSNLDFNSFGTTDDAMDFYLFGDSEPKPVSDLQETPPAIDIDPGVSEGRRALNMIVVVDVSGSMAGERIASVNNALENVFGELKRSSGSLDAAIKVAILEFSASAKWKMNTPIPVEDLVFTELTTTPYITNYATAFNALNEKLSRKAFMDPNLTDYFAPLILFVTDGEPTDTEEYPQALRALRKNGWFNEGLKYAIAVGKDAKSERVSNVLAEFTGDKDNVRYAEQGSKLCDLIQYVLVRGSKIQTKMLSTGDNAPQEKLFSNPDPDLWDSMFKTQIQDQ